MTNEQLARAIEILSEELLKQFGTSAPPDYYKLVSALSGAAERIRAPCEVCEGAGVIYSYDRPEPMNCPSCT